jgi:predicted TIM-barrel fold metal-dependent hydrolase
VDLTEYTPVAKLVTRTTMLTRPRFPVIDAHNHLGSSSRGWFARPVSEMIDMLDESGVAVFVDLDGGVSEETLAAHLDKHKQAAPDRFVVYGGIEWEAWPGHGDRFGEWAAGRMRAQAARGAQGLKIFKEFGLLVRDQNSALVAVDDPRLDPVWATAGELKWPVTIHVADPVAFFDPLDNKNERWEELHHHPGWHFPSPPFPAFMSLVNGLANVVARHPQTTFVAAHVGCYAENLEWVGQLLDRCPNFNVDMSARVAELGRQPYSARRFFLRYADRIVFGLDELSTPERYRIAYRFLETDDEYFAYGVEGIPSQGRWRIYGLFLPDDVLQKVYYKNAARIILER